jgi:hypothetical protein
MRFYRGISVPRQAADAVMAKISSQGLQPGDGQWTMLTADLKSRLDEIGRKPAISLADTRPNIGNPSWVCACGEELGALYYACRHNKSAENDTPILIAFEADPSEAIVDGRDFLYTAFQLGDPKRARAIVERLFGKAVLRYADRAWSGDQKERIALCDLAVQDNAVVLAHASNRTVIAGRFRTRFRSAFLVRTPVAAERIADVRIVDSEFELPKAEVSLDEIR